MNKDNGRKRYFAPWQKQTSGKFDGLVVKLDGVLLESGFRPGFISTGFRPAHPYQKRHDRYRGRQQRYVIDVRHV